MPIELDNFPLCDASSLQWSSRRAEIRCTFYIGQVRDRHMVAKDGSKGQPELDQEAELRS